MSKPHIVIDGRFLRRSTGGIGRYTQALIRELINLASPYRYTVLLRPADQADWAMLVEPLKVDTDQWQTHVVDIPHYSLAEQTKLIQVLRGLKPDLVHFTNFNHPIRWRSPFVVTIHDLTILKYPVGTRQASKVFQWAFRQTLRHAALASRQVITVSETSKNDLVGLLHLPPAKVAVTYEGVDEIFQPVNLPLRGRGQRLLAEKLHLRPPYLLFVSQWRPHKGLPILIEAYDLFRKANPRLKPQLVVVGQPNADYPEILAAIKKSPYGEDIVRPGFISETDLVHLYQTAEAFVFPSLYEGFGLPPLEAMAAGTPVIASDTSCLPEILGEAARLVPANDPSALASALAEVVTNRLLWRQLRAAGLARVRQFSWRKMGQETLAIYKAALE
ncbi:MAG: glycosyltransferase family 1 protein [Patescibacteria group bacterium]